MDAFLFLGAVLLGLVGMGTAGFCLYLLLSKWMIFKVKICEVGLGMDSSACFALVATC